MEIKTKFNIGETVWFIETGIRSGEICNFKIFVFNDGEIQIRYNVTGYSVSDINEKHLFATKEEILTQLH